MPYVPDTPDTGAETIVQPRTLDKFHILSMTFQLVPGDPGATQAVIVWAKGYESDGNFVAVETHHASMAGEYFATCCSTAVTPGNTRYDEIKTALWSLLEHFGHVGTGTVA